MNQIPYQNNGLTMCQQMKQKTKKKAYKILLRIFAKYNVFFL